ncbi:MAG: TIGR02302 family protein [Rhodospirillales bacterium]
MSGSGPAKPPPHVRLLWILGLARTVLLWERLWSRFWKVAALAGLFVSIALLDVLPFLPGWLHVLVLAVFAIGLAIVFRQGMAGFRQVDVAMARHRLERDSGLRHRPLTALADRLAADSGNRAVLDLWRAHLARMSRAVGRLRLRIPSPGVASLDPFGLRAAVFLFLVIALAASRGDAAGRLERAFIPRFDGSLGGPLSLDIWVTPPAYTGLAPLFLDKASEKTEAVKVPVGSALMAQTGGTRSAPRLWLGGRRLEFAKLAPQDFDSGGHRLDAVIEDSDHRLAVDVDGRELVSWPLEVIADAPPKVAFGKTPTAASGARLRLDFEASDDYGLGGLRAVIRRADESGGADRGSIIRLALPFSGIGSKKARGTTIQDLTAHPWAGLPVQIRLLAVDAIGQRGKSRAAQLVLPERTFNHPIARAIIAERKKLSTPSAGVGAEVARALDGIAVDAKPYFNETVVFLALAVARARLFHDRTGTVIASVQRLLWNTAIGIEDGKLSLAERQLRRAQTQLMEALANNAKPGEIDRLMDALQWALNKYLAALQDRLQGRKMMEMPPGIPIELITNDDLRQLLEEARELARAGAVDAARRLLSELERFLNGFSAALSLGEADKELTKVLGLMQDLNALADQQRKLLDESFRRLRERSGGDARPERRRQGRRRERESRPWSEGSAARQDKLRHGLGDVMLRFDETLGKIPRQLGEAERAMREAVESFTRGRPETAVRRQGEALEKLRQAQKDLAQRIARRLSGRLGAVRGSPASQPGWRRDPFGRFPDGAFGNAFGERIKIPDRMEIRRARKILRELRRRAGERQRPKLERDYIERLLRRF